MSAFRVRNIPMRLLVALLLCLLCLAVGAQTQYAKPRKGEGITTFLQRHGRSGQEYYREFLELNKQSVCFLLVKFE